MGIVLSILSGDGDGPRELEEVTVGWSSPSENHAGGELHTPALRDLVLERLPAHPEAPVQVLVEASAVAFQRGLLAK